MILQVFDFGRPVATALLADRPVATLVGAVIALTADVTLDQLIPTLQRA